MGNKSNTDHELFTWKSDGKIFKGVGVYHLTFNVASPALKLGTVRGRSKEEIAAVVQPLLDAGEACDASNPRYVEAVRQMAWVELTPLGKAVDRDLADFGRHHDGVQVCRRVVMDSHVHIVVWVKKNTGKTILQMAHGFRTGITKVAKEMGVWPVAGATQTSVSRSGNNDTPNTYVTSGNNNTQDGMVSVTIEKACDAGPYHVFEKPFVRTLWAQGQLQTMIDYVKLNPYRRWILVLHPELFRLHRCTRIAGLRFRSMGNHWLLDWPVRQMVECRRMDTQAEWDKQLEGVMERAKGGAVTFTAGMNNGERYIAEKIRQAGYPLVMLLKDGFPKEGSWDEKKYKPGGVFNDACGQGKLLFLETTPENYEDTRIEEKTEISLKRKAKEKHLAYKILPHDSMRWRSIACNEMIRLLCERGQD